jgi:hypothetical protein
MLTENMFSAKLLFSRNIRHLFSPPPWGVILWQGSESDVPGGGLNSPHILLAVIERGRAPAVVKSLLMIQGTKGGLGHMKGGGGDGTISPLLFKQAEHIPGGRHFHSFPGAGGFVHRHENPPCALLKYRSGHDYKIPVIVTFLKFNVKCFLSQTKKVLK